MADRATQTRYCSSYHYACTFHAASAAAAEIEERLAADAKARQEWDKALRLRYSAASGWAYAGLS